MRFGFVSVKLNVFSFTYIPIVNRNCKLFGSITFDDESFINEVNRNISVSSNQYSASFKGKPPFFLPTVSVKTGRKFAVSRVFRVGS